jgi:hypothetical protein
MAAETASQLIHAGNTARQLSSGKGNRHIKTLRKSKEKVIAIGFVCIN